MTDEDETPAFELGDGDPVEGAPLARISARLMWGIERSTVREREGETPVRTPDGPRELAEILDEVDRTYFDTRQSFEDAVRDVIGTGAIPTAADREPGEASGNTADEPDAQ